MKTVSIFNHVICPVMRGLSSTRLSELCCTASGGIAAIPVARALKPGCFGLAYASCP